MKEIILFHLEHCPYCVKARQALQELTQQNPAYGGVRIRWIEESEEAALAASYDYYYVPTLYYEGEKLYEAHPSEDYAAIKENIRAALERVLAAPIREN